MGGTGSRRVWKRVRVILTCGLGGRNPGVRGTHNHRRKHKRPASSKHAPNIGGGAPPKAIPGDYVKAWFRRQGPKGISHDLTSAYWGDAYGDKGKADAAVVMQRFRDQFKRDRGVTAGSGAGASSPGRLKVFAGGAKVCVGSMSADECMDKYGPGLAAWLTQTPWGDMIQKPTEEALLHRDESGGYVPMATPGNALHVKETNKAGGQYVLTTAMEVAAVDPLSDDVHEGQKFVLDITVTQQGKATWTVREDSAGPLFPHAKSLLSEFDKAEGAATFP